MTMAVNLKEEVVEALTMLGGSGTADEVREHLKSKYGRDWKNIEAVMDDLSVESKSSFFPPEDRILRRTGQGKYSLKETGSSEKTEKEIPSGETVLASAETNPRIEVIAASYAEKLRGILDQPKYAFASANPEQVSEVPGIYIIYNNSSKEQLIYVGRTRNLRRSLLGQLSKGDIRGSRFNKALGQKQNLHSETEISHYIAKNCSFQYFPVESLEERVRLEHFIVAILAPTLNAEPEH